MDSKLHMLIYVIILLKLIQFRAWLNDYIPGDLMDVITYLCINSDLAELLTKQIEAKRSIGRIK